MSPRAVLIAALLLACRKEHASRDTPSSHGDPTTEEPTVDPPSTTAPANTGAGVTSVAQTIAKLSPRFKRCYEQGLRTDAKMSGNMVIDVRVAPDGSVLDATKASGSGLSASVETCMLTEVRRATFDPPGGTGSTLQVPINFKAQ